MIPDRPRPNKTMPAPSTEVQTAADDLMSFIRSNAPVFVITGAGISTESGIPDYRDQHGEWKRQQPMRFQDFAGSAANRRRYWQRSVLGWRQIHQARPNPAHHAITQLYELGYLGCVLTQNVDGLHGLAGLKEVLELHGALRDVVCLACREKMSRSEFQCLLEASNPHAWSTRYVTAPHGDAELHPGWAYDAFTVPACPQCGSNLKPDVVFFGEAVPRERIERAYRALSGCRGLLAVGTSLMVYSGFRFCRKAAQEGKPIAILSKGATRADSLAARKYEFPAAKLLAAATAGSAKTDRLLGR